MLKTKHIVAVNDNYFKDKFGIFNNPECKVLRTIIEDDLFKDDELHSKLLKAKIKADKELRDYEYNKRFN